MLIIKESIEPIEEIEEGIESWQWGVREWDIEGEIEDRIDD